MENAETESAFREEPPLFGHGGEPTPIQEYLRKLERALKRGDSTEHTHRPALKELLEAINDKIIATNEPKRSECGAPDYVVSRTRDHLSVGYVGAKDIGADLAEIEKGEQIKRYLASLPSLILTDYLEFRWFVDGKKRESFRLASVASNGKLRPVSAEEQERAKHLLVSFLSQRPVEITSAEELARLDMRKNTIVIFASDHGYNLGEHDCWQKLSLFEESTRVPLLISAPGFERNAGKSAKGIVELIDIYSTIADLIGLKEKAPAILQGTSLRPLLEKPDRKDWSKTVAYTVTHQKGESIRTPRWRYSVWGKEGEELYDLDKDPQEFTNLAQNSKYQTQLNEMRALMGETRQRATQ